MATSSAQPFGMIGLISGAGSGTPSPSTAQSGDDAFGHDVRPKPIRESALTLAGDGNISISVVRRNLYQDFREFRTCYDAARTGNPRLQGTVSARFVIDQHGAVQGAQDDGSQIGDSGVVQCVLTVLGRTSFPQPSGGPVAVHYRVLMTPPDNQ